MAEQDKSWEYPYSELGEKEVKAEGDTLEVKFTGKGYLIPKYESQEGILTDNPDDWAGYERRLSLEGLFPLNWRRDENGQRVEPEVEYEIIVKAKRIPPTQ